MAWNPSPKVADCREIARKWGKQQVIIIAVDYKAGTTEYASYGETRVLCDDAKLLADTAYNAITNCTPFAAWIEKSESRNHDPARDSRQD